MPIEFTCRNTGCGGTVRESQSADSATCPECGRVYRRSSKHRPRDGVADSPATTDEEPAMEVRSSGGSPRPPIPSKKRKGRKGKSKKPRRSFGAMAALFEKLSYLTPFLLGRVLPVLAVIVVCVVVVVSNNQRRIAAKQKARLTETLWNDVRGASTDSAANPYVRGKLAILETQSMVEFDLQEPSRPQHWINDYIKPPLARPQEIGSVILVEWNVIPRQAKVHLELTGQTREVTLKEWNCHVKLIDVKRRSVVYSADLSTDVNPLHVTESQLTAEFDKILKLPQIGLDDEPPAQTQ